MTHAYVVTQIKDTLAQLKAKRNANRHILCCKFSFCKLSAGGEAGGGYTRITLKQSLHTNPYCFKNDINLFFFMCGWIKMKMSNSCTFRETHNIKKKWQQQQQFKTGVSWKKMTKEGNSEHTTQSHEEMRTRKPESYGKRKTKAFTSTVAQETGDCKW